MMYQGWSPLSGRPFIASGDAMHISSDTIDIFLQPGDCFVGDAGYTMRTLLGSCVSITLWHPESCTGAMSHFLLPNRVDALCVELDGRYGEDALQLMLEGMQQSGIDPQRCEAKIFGGASMFPQQELPRGFHVGQRNGMLARKLLREHGIPIVSQHLYGVGHRQMIFQVATGDVWARQLPLAGIPERKAA